MRNNARNENGNLRRKNRARFRAMASECGICHGRLGAIHYDEPSDYKHPLSFVIDEIIPISRAKDFGYPSARAAAEDFNNLQAAHWCCNAAKSNKINFDLVRDVVGNASKNSRKKMTVADGDW